jgi:toxin ParE1/3/4
MATYKLSFEAEGDLDGIYYTGVVEFGLQQADDYYDGLMERFQRIADTPLMYPDVSFIREGYRRSVFGAHSIYYQIKAEHVFIVRIIGQQDTGSI